jgi:MoxR-like ATPase
MPNMTIESASKNLRAVAANLKARFKNRDKEIDLMCVSAIAGEFMLLIGPRGEAKTAIVDAFSKCVTGARHFEEGLSKTSTIDQILGGVDVPALSSQGVFRRNTAGYLPECETFLLDEGFKAPSDLLNALLRVLSERRYQNTPTPTLFGVLASNEYPSELRRATNGVPTDLGPHEDSMLPFMDRFFYCSEVTSLPKGGDDWCSVVFDGCANADDGARVSVDELRFLQNAVKAVKIGQAAKEMIVRTAAGLDAGEIDGKRVVVSTRRWVKATGVAKAHALYRGGQTVKPRDLLDLEFALWTTPDQRGTVSQMLRLALPPSTGEGIVVVEEIEARAAHLRAGRLIYDTASKSYEVMPSPVSPSHEGFSLAATALDTAARRATRNLSQAQAAAEDDEDRAEIAAAIARLAKVTEEITVIAHKAAKAAR